MKKDSRKLTLFLLAPTYPNGTQESHDSELEWRSRCGKFKQPNITIGDPERRIGVYARGTTLVKIGAWHSSGHQIKSQDVGILEYEKEGGSQQRLVIENTVNWRSHGSMDVNNQQLGNRQQK